MSPYRTSADPRPHECPSEDAGHECLCYEVPEVLCATCKGAGRVPWIIGSCRCKKCDGSGLEQPTTASRSGTTVERLQE